MASSLKKANNITRDLGSGRLDKSTHSLRSIVNIPQQHRQYDGILQIASEGL
jgi:hypothetical protein